MDNPVTFSDITLLNTLATCANMTTDEVFKDFKIMANKKILKNHKYEIYYSESEKSWRTYLPDETKPNKRRPVKRKSKENLAIQLSFYLFVRCSRFLQTIHRCLKTCLCRVNFRLTCIFFCKNSLRFF